MRVSHLFVTLASVTLLSSVYAQPLRWTSAGDILTFDIHSQNENLNSMACAAVYEGLVRWDRDMKVAPALATSWKRVPEGFAFELRRGVSFHEGQPFGADDVVFSLQRALSPKSQFKGMTTGIVGVKKTGPYSVVVLTSSGSPVLLNQLTDLRIMSVQWAQAHHVTEPQDFVNHQESYAARHANGTGPFKLRSREVDVKTVFEINTGWWDSANRTGNVTEAVFLPIGSAATRTAALLAGQVDFILDPATQDLAQLKKNPQVRVIEGSENRVLMVSLDQHREDSPYIRGRDGKPLGANPFRDLRVRQAMDLAVNRQGLVRAVMRGSAVPTGTIVAKNVNGWSAAVAQVPRYDVARSRELLRQAGYPDGFAFTLDTPNNRWINDENIAKALASMWAKVGIQVSVNSMPRAQYFPKVLSFDSSAGLVGWGATTFDALVSLQSLSASFNKATGNGISNIGRVSNAQLDVLLESIRAAEDPAARNALIGRALQLERDEVLHITLHEQTIPWAMRRNIELVQRPDNRLTMEWVTVR